MRITGVAALGLAGMLAGLNAGCLAVAAGGIAYVEGKQVEARGRERAAQIQADAYRDVHSPVYVERTSEEIMNYFYNTQTPTIFVCNRVIEIDGVAGLGPKDFIGVDKVSFGMNESITMGAYLPNNGGDKISLRLLTPSGRELRFERTIPQDGYVHIESIDPQNKECGRNILMADLNNKFWQKVEFDVTER